MEYEAQRAILKAYVHRARKGSNPNTIQFYMRVFLISDSERFDRFSRNLA